MTPETINEQLKMPVLTDKQKFRFRLLGERVKRKEISVNKAYGYAQVDGDGKDDLGFKGSLKEFINTSIENEWFEGNEPKVEKAQEIKVDKIIEATKEEPRKTDWVTPIIIGSAIAILLIYAIKKYGKKE